MQRTQRTSFRLQPIRFFGIGLIVAPLCGAGITYTSYRQDRARLRIFAQTVAEGQSTPTAMALGLMHGVHNIRGTARNPRSFLIPRLGATPLQVLEGGGDCADKSRLLCALLREIDISATPALCFDAQTGLPAHTIVEARTADGERMILDPAFDLCFPRLDASGYYGLFDLRKDAAIVERRIADIRVRNPDLSEVDVYYLRSPAAYETASTFNWKKNACTRFLFSCLRPWYGDELYRLPRPILMEEPKWAITLLCLVVGGGLPCCGYAWTRSRRAQSRAGAQASSQPRIAVPEAITAPGAIT